MGENPASILITGASSGIGEALAVHYAADNVTLFLSGRNEERLIRVAEACKNKGASVEPMAIDVTDKPAMANWISSCAVTRPLDLVIANAGISAGSSKGLEETTLKTFATNIDGVLFTIFPALEHMRAKKSGQIAIISSLAGLAGLPGAPAYSASKAAVRSYGESLRGLYKKDGVKVNVVLPGFVTSGITAKNKFPMPFIMPADKAARIIANGLARNKARIAFPWPMYFLMLAINALPMWLKDRLFTRLPEKN